MGSTFEEEKKGVKITENTTKWLKENLTLEEFRLVNKALENKMRPSELAQSGNLKISKDRMNLLDVVYGRMNLHLKGNNAYLNSEDIKAIREFMKMAEFKKMVPNLVTREKTYVATAHIGVLTFKVEVTGKPEGISDVLTAIAEGNANPEQLKEKGVKIYSVDVEGKEKEVPIGKALPLLKNAEFTDIRPKRE